LASERGYVIVESSDSHPDRRIGVAAMSKFDVYALQDNVPVSLGTADNLADAEQIIKSQLSPQQDFVVYSQRTGVNIFYERTPDGFVTCKSLKQALVAGFPSHRKPRLELALLEIFRKLPALRKLRGH
jgi:hypothetical protein